MMSHIMRSAVLRRFALFVFCIFAFCGHTVRHSGSSGFLPQAHAGTTSDLIFYSGFETPMGACSSTNPDPDNDGLLDLGCIQPFTPPDPASLAPPINGTVVTDFSVVNSFIFTGSNPIQRGVAPGAIKPYRMAVLRGMVVDANQAPLPGVLVRVLNHPEYGYTYTRADGVFDLAVNGGGDITVDYRKDGYLRAQRHAITPWKDWKWLQQTTMIPVDSAVTAIGLNATADIQVHRANPVTDSDGTRQATVMFQPGTTGYMVMPDGSPQPLYQIHFRATEYTVGPNGPDRMPAGLPASSGYTYAVELSADEAIAADARTVKFDQPIVLYFENFLGFPVGEHIPLGSYDFRQGSWLPSPDGRVVKILSITGNSADLDVDGSGQPANAQTLTQLGISDAERIKLAQLYPVGQELWRTQMSHLTPWDGNFPYGPPADAEPPTPPSDPPYLADPPTDPNDPYQVQGPPYANPPDPTTSANDDPNPCYSSGSIIDCSNARLGEVVPVAGTPFQLSYQSAELPGGNVGKYRVRVPVTGANIPNYVIRAEGKIELGGSTHYFVLDPIQANYYYDFDWDGKDAYGRPWQGPVQAQVEVGYVYPLYYQSSQAAFEKSWANFSGSPLFGVLSTREMIDWQEWSPNASVRERTLFTGAWNSQGLSLGGWTISGHHLFDPTSQTLYTGDGHRRPIGAIGANAIVAIAPYSKTITPTSNWILGPGGEVYSLATGGCGCSCAAPQVVTICDAVESIDIQWPGDVSAAVSLQNCLPDPVNLGACAAGSVPLWTGGQHIAVEDDDTLILQTSTMLYRIVPSQSSVVPIFDLSTLSGTCDKFTSPPAVLDRRVYFACLRSSDNAGFVYMVWPTGDVTLLAGGGTQTASGSTASASAFGRIEQIVPASNGDLYLNEPSSYWIRKIGNNGIVSVVAGNGTNAYTPDGAVAGSASITSVTSMAMSNDGTLLFAEDGRVRQVEKNGQMSTLLGGGNISYVGSEAIGRQVSVWPTSMQVAPDGSVVFDGCNALCTWSGSSFRFDGVGQGFRIPSEDGSEVYVFDPQGRHLQTLNALTGAVRYTFQYNDAGYLVGITDGDGNTTTIQRDANNNAVAIVSPYGVTTALQEEADGMLDSIASAAGQVWQMTYDPNNLGLMLSFQRPLGFASTFNWDTDGRLQKDANAIGGFKAINRYTWDYYSAVEGGVTTAMNRSKALESHGSAGGDVYRTVANADGSSAASVTTRDYSRIVADAPGDSVSTTYSPDPRFGIQAALPSTTNVTVPGLSPYQAFFSRTVTPTVPNADLGQLDVQDQITVNGRVYTRSYNSAARTWTLTSPQGRSVVTTIDAQSRPIQSQVPGLAAIDYAYDGHGRLHTVTTGSGTDERQWTLDYDNNGYLSSVQDPIGRLISLTNDAVGRLTEETLPDGNVVDIGYDADNNVTSITPPSRGAHTFTYNAVDRLTAYQPPSLGAVASSTGYSDNLDSQLQQVTDADNRSASIGFASNSTLPATLTLPTETRNYGFTAGQLTSITSNSGVSNGFSWAGSLPAGETWQGPVAGSVTPAYDSTNGQSNFWITRLTVADAVSDSLAVSYAYDNDGLMTSAYVPADGWYMYLKHDAQNGLLDTTSLYNVSDVWSYNLFAEPTAYTAMVYTAVNGSVPIYSARYTRRDQLGRIVHKEETIGTTTHTADYTYDLAGRLLTITRDGTLAVTYAYDANGNRLSATTASGVISGTYDAQDRMTAYGDDTFAYNQSGQLTQRTNTQTNAITSYTYDTLGNLQHVGLPSGHSIDYVVDGLNRRIGKKVDGTLVQGFLYLNRLHPAAELDGSGHIISTFIYADRTNVPSYMIKGTQAYRIIADQLGSPRLVVDASTGAIMQELDYDEWGNVVNDTNPGFQPFGFAGGIYDRDIGLVRFGARDYDPSTARWTAKDPINFVGDSANLYAYVGGNPLSRIDASGNQWLDVLIKPMLLSDEPITARPLLEPKLSNPAGTPNPELPPDFPSLPNDPSQSPGPGWEWRGKGQPGGDQGAWYNPEKDWSLHPDLDHPDPIGPHWDWVDENGKQWRVFPKVIMCPGEA